MKKWIGLILLVAMSAGAATTNTFTGTAGVNWSGPNWNVSPASWSDYSANLVFGSVATNRYTPNNNAANPASIGSMTFTAAATTNYTVSGSAIRFLNASNNNNNVIINNSSYEVTINPGLTFNFGVAGDRYIRAVGGNIHMKSVSLWSDSTVFQANAGRTNSIDMLTAGGANRLAIAEGDGVIGGTLRIDSIIANGYAVELEARQAALINLNTADGMLGDITLRSGQISFSQNRSAGTLTFADTLVSGFDNTVKFNGSDISFDALAITAVASEKNVLDFSDGDSSITFADSSSEAWLNGLVVSNFEVGVDTLRFGTDASGLTSEQLAMITVDGKTGASLDPNGFLAIPEPATVGLFIISSITILIGRRMRYCP